jgi:hypothetical protein
MGTPPLAGAPPVPIAPPPDGTIATAPPVAIAPPVAFTALEELPFPSLEQAVPKSTRMHAIRANACPREVVFVSSMFGMLSMAPSPEILSLRPVSAQGFARSISASNNDGGRIPRARSPVVLARLQDVARTEEHDQETRLE